MKWRCVECGRPHESDSPPCECGSGQFERAVVRVTHRCTACGYGIGQHEDTCPSCGFRTFEPVDPGPTAGEMDSSYTQWRCEECGREHPRNNPPCVRCGSMQFEHEQVEDIDIQNYVEGAGEEGSVPWWLVAVVVLVLVGFVVVTML